MNEMDIVVKNKQVYVKNTTTILKNLDTNESYGVILNFKDGSTFVNSYIVDFIFEGKDICKVKFNHNNIEHIVNINEIKEII